MAKKGATNSGSGKNNQKQKDQARASFMKEHNIQRTSGQCPICNQLVAQSKFGNHIATHR